MKLNQLKGRLNLANDSTPAEIIEKLSKIKIKHGSGNGSPYNLLDYDFVHYGMIVRIFGPFRYSFIMIENTECTKEELFKMALKKLMEWLFFQKILTGNYIIFNH